ncbi:hypothetical protein OAR36_13120 [Pseudomonadales bacterium]|nr:hypothetical protein [Pseudomonadales bacterium]
MHSNVKTALGIFLFFFFGYFALLEISESASSSMKRFDISTPLISYFKPELFALVFMPLLLATGWRVWSGESHWSSAWYHSGVPLGILASSISLVAILQTSKNFIDIEQGRTLIAESLLAIVYGGIVSLIGYLNLREGFIPIKRNSHSNIPRFFVALLFCCLIGKGMDYYVGLNAFIDTATVSIYLAIICLFLLANRDESKSVCQLICEAMVMISLATVAIALVSYINYQGYPQLAGPAVAIGILGPLYGSFGILLCAIFLPEKDLQATNFSLINWHLLEISCFFILMSLAPKSVLEMFSV